MRIETREQGYEAEKKKNVSVGLQQTNQQATGWGLTPEDKGRHLPPRGVEKQNWDSNPERNQIITKIHTQSIFIHFHPESN